MNERDPLDRLFIEHLAGRVQSLEEQVQVLMSQRMSDLLKFNSSMNNLSKRSR